MSIALDDSRWPVVTIRWEGATTDDEMAAHLERIDEILARRQPWLSIIEVASGSGTPSPRQMNLQAEYIRRNQAVIREYSLGTVFVVGSIMMRTVLRGVLTFQPPPDEHKIVATLEEAQAWARERFARASLPQPLGV